MNKLVNRDEGVTLALQLGNDRLDSLDGLRTIAATIMEQHDRTRAHLVQYVFRNHIATGAVIVMRVDRPTDIAIGKIACRFDALDVDVASWRANIAGRIANSRLNRVAGFLHLFAHVIRFVAIEEMLRVMRIGMRRHLMTRIRYPLGNLGIRFRLAAQHEEGRLRAVLVEHFQNRVRIATRLGWTVIERERHKLLVIGKNGMQVFHDPRLVLLHFNLSRLAGGFAGARLRDALLTLLRHHMQHAVIEIEDVLGGAFLFRLLIARDLGFNRGRLLRCGVGLRAIGTVFRRDISRIGNLVIEVHGVAVEIDRRVVARSLFQNRAVHGNEISLRNPQRSRIDEVAIGRTPVDLHLLTRNRIGSRGHRIDCASNEEHDNDSHRRYENVFRQLKRISEVEAARCRAAASSSRAGTAHDSCNRIESLVNRTRRPTLGRTGWTRLPSFILLITRSRLLSARFAPRIARRVAPRIGRCVSRVLSAIARFASHEFPGHISSLARHILALRTLTRHALTLCIARLTLGISPLKLRIARLAWRVHPRGNTPSL